MTLQEPCSPCWGHRYHPPTPLPKLETELASASLMTPTPDPCLNSTPPVTQSSLLSIHTSPPSSQAPQVKPPSSLTLMTTEVSSQAYPNLSRAHCHLCSTQQREGLSKMQIWPRRPTTPTSNVHTPYRGSRICACSG